MTLGAGSCGLQARSGLHCHRVLVWRRLRVGSLRHSFSKRLRKGLSVESESDIRNWQLWAAGTIPAFAAMAFWCGKACVCWRLGHSIFEATSERIFCRLRKMTLGTGSCGLQARSGLRRDIRRGKIRPSLPWCFGVVAPACWRLGNSIFEATSDRIF